MLNKYGGIMADLTVSVLEQDPANVEQGSTNPVVNATGYMLDIGGAIGEHAWGHLKDVIYDKEFNVNLMDHSEEIGMLSVQGPHSRQLLEEICSEDLSNKSFPFS